MDNFYIFKSQIEQDIMQLAKSTQSILANISTKPDSKCKQRTYNQCQTTAHKYCVQDFPWQPKCFTKGAKISYNSGIRFPNNIKFDKTGRCIICQTTSLDKTFRRIKQKHNFKIQSIYVGLYIGTFRRFPSQQQQNKDGVCTKSYDPRKRFWYVGASTGPKNMVITIDLSNQVSPQELDYIRKSVQELIKTLTFNDFFSVILYSNTAKTLLYQNLTRAKNEVKNAIISSIKTLQIDKQYKGNITSAYQMASELLRNESTESDIYGPPCKFSTNIIISITGSKDNEFAININEWKTLQMTKIFIYNIANTENVNFKSLTCQNQGAYFLYSSIQDLQRLPNQLRIYERFVVNRLNIDSPIWTQPYDDFFTNSRMITMAMPIYYYHLNGSYKQDNRMIVGVAGVDVLMQTLQQYIISEETVIKQLIKCSLTSKIKFDSCTINHLRPNNRKCQVDCPQDGDKQPIICPFQVGEQNVFYEMPKNRNVSLEKGQDIYFCCSLSLEAGVILVSICLLILIIALVGFGKYYFKKKYEQLGDGSQTTSRNQTESMKRQTINLSEISRNIGSMERLGQNKNAMDKQQPKIQQKNIGLIHSNQKVVQSQLKQKQININH